MNKSFIWDLPTRLFHWAIVILLCVSFYTGQVGGFEIMDYHMWSGYTVLALVLFRVIWGFIGSQNSRFTSFIKGPKATLAYLRGEVSVEAGHNPLGALSVVAILLALSLQVGTGLFANDDIMLEGPLSHLVSYDTSRTLTGVHKINRWVILGLISLHLIAVLFYQLVRKDKLIVPMITGWKVLEQELPAERNNYLLAIVVLGLCAGGVYGLITYL